MMETVLVTPKMDELGLATISVSGIACVVRRSSCCGQLATLERSEWRAKCHRFLGVYSVRGRTGTPLSSYAGVKVKP